MATFEKLELAAGVSSDDAVSELVWFLGNAVRLLDSVGFQNRWSDNDITEHYLIAAVAPGVEVDSNEWNETYEQSQKEIAVREGTIHTAIRTYDPVYAHVYGDYPYRKLDGLTDRAADTWHSRIAIQSSTTEIPDRIILDSWRMPMYSFWERVNNTEIGSDEELSAYRKWYDSWKSVDENEVPIRALDVKRDIIEGEGTLDNGARRRLNWFAAHMGSLVTNVHEQYLHTELI